MAHRVTIEGGCLYKSATDCSCKGRRGNPGADGTFPHKHHLLLDRTHCAYCRTTGNLGNLGQTERFLIRVPAWIHSNVPDERPPRPLPTSQFVTIPA